jgi:hypothetical protein
MVQQSTTKNRAARNAAAGRSDIVLMGHTSVIGVDMILGKGIHGHWLRRSERG